MYNDALIYGFGAYANYTHNVTVEIIEQVHRRGIAPAMVFETRFSRAMFEHALLKHKPGVVIGLGQDSRARKVRIERKAVNWRKPLAGKGQPISRNGAKQLYVPLKIQSLPGTTIAYDAGDYVCNFSMYVMCQWCQVTGAKFAFLHLPLAVDTGFATLMIERILRSVYRQSGGG